MEKEKAQEMTQELLEQGWKGSGRYYIVSPDKQASIGVSPDAGRVVVHYPWELTEGIVETLMQGTDNEDWTGWTLKRI